MPGVLRPAGFWIRAVAFLLDEILLGVTVGALAVLTVLALWIQFIQRGLTVVSALVVGLLFAVVGIGLHAFYHTYLTGRLGQTVGKMAFGLQVVRVGGGPVGYGRAGLRWIGHLLTSLTLGVGFLAILIHPDKRGLPDWVAGTRVIHEEEGP